MARSVVSVANRLSGCGNASCRVQACASLLAKPHRQPVDFIVMERIAKNVRCPVCGGGTAWESNPWRPFCSERCQLTDLGAWASEWYRVPGSSLTTPSAFDEFEESSDERPL